jgi:hypothetical protein
MESNRWKWFVRVVKIISVPLGILVFYFFGDERFGWIGNLCFIILFSLALIGGIRGLLIYGFRKQPLPLSGQVEQMQRGYNDDTMSSSLKSKYKIILLTIFLFLAVLSEVYFAWGVFQIASVGSEMELVRGSPFVLGKTGIYTLWKSSGYQNTPSILNTAITPEVARQFQINRIGDKRAVPIRFLSSAAIYRKNGECFIAICNYVFSAPGSYCLLAPDQKSDRLLLKRSISSGITGSTFASFFMGILFVILGWYTFSAKRANKLPPSG